MPGLRWVSRQFCDDCNDSSPPDSRQPWSIPLIVSLEPLLRPRIPGWRRPSSPWENTSTCFDKLSTIGSFRRFQSNSPFALSLSKGIPRFSNGLLRESDLFRRVTVDPEVHALVWPNGADFYPEALHDWPLHARELAERARGWEIEAA